MGKLLAQQFDVVLRAGRTVVLVMQEKLDAIEHDAETGAVPDFDTFWAQF